jgi:cell division protease FtsH
MSGSDRHHHGRRNYNPFGRKYLQQLQQKQEEEAHTFHIVIRRYPLSRPHFEEYLRRLNSQNATIQHEAILGGGGGGSEEFNITQQSEEFLNANLEYDEDEDTDNGLGRRRVYGKPSVPTKSANFEVTFKNNITFQDVGGYELVKKEFEQCMDMLKHYHKYVEYNVRIPKGAILEGPPGTGKTLLAKAFAGEVGCGFIAVSGSDFQEKYVGVGPMRIKELFDLAKKNVPCVIFIDEIDAVGKKRSTDNEASTSERDSTLNALLVELDGFKSNVGVFLLAATNRVDLLDPALVRPGRIDKKIYIGLPDVATRKAILSIHVRGKPSAADVSMDALVENTEGFSGAQLENLLNEAMLQALRNNGTEFTNADIEMGMNKMIGGWQPTEQPFTEDLVQRIAIHEMGHVVVGLLAKHHSKVNKVVIHLHSPKTPAYTVFQGSATHIYTSEALMEHLMILLGGRIAEEVFYGVSVTTGAVNDFEEALKLAEKMVVHYGMGKNVLYPRFSEKYKEKMDEEIHRILQEAYRGAERMIREHKEFVEEMAVVLKREKVIRGEDLYSRLHKANI